MQITECRYPGGGPSVPTRGRPPARHRPRGINARRSGSEVFSVPPARLIGLFVAGAPTGCRAGAFGRRPTSKGSPPGALVDAGTSVR
jgi:hypothetical protein